MANENKEANGLPVYKAKSYLLLTLREVKAKYLKLLPEAKPVAFFQHPKQKVPLYRLDQCEQIVVIGEFNGLPIYWKKPTDLFTDSDLRQMGLELISKAEPTAVLKREKSRIGDYLYTISQSIPRWKWEKNHFGDAIPASK